MCGLISTSLLVNNVVHEYFNNPRLVSGFSFARQPDTGYQLSDSQQNYIDENGNPASFSILFYQHRDTNGALQDNRYETWHYLDSGIQVTFLNGMLSEADSSPLEGGEKALTYKPEMFTAYMSPAQVAQSADIDEWLIIPVEDALVQNAEVYFADGLTFGFQNGELIFVEAFTAEEGE